MGTFIWDSGELYIVIILTFVTQDWVLESYEITKRCIDCYIEHH